MNIPPNRKLLCCLLFLTLNIPSVTSADNNLTSSASLFELPLTELMNIKISTAGKTREKIKNIPASVVIVTRKEIERYGYTTLTDILENAPGMYNIYSYAGAPGNFGVRGFWNPYSQNSNIAFLINGVKQINDEAGSSPMAKITVPTEAIDRIEIIKGPMSVIYGSGASFGVINIITNEVSEQHNISLISATYGSRDTSKVAMRISENSGDLKLVVNASAYQTDGLDNKFSDLMSPTNHAALPLFGVTDPDYSTDGLLEHENEYLGVSGSYKKLYFDTSVQNTDVDIYAIAPSLRSGIERSSNNFSLLLGYRDDVNNQISYDANLAYFDHDDGDVLDFFDPTAFGIRDVEYETWEAELAATLTPSTQWNIIVGLNQRTMTNHNELFDIPAAQADPVSMITPIKQVFSRDNVTTQSIFTQATYTPTDKITLVAGIRWENHPSYDYTILEDIGMPGESLLHRHVESSDDFLPRAAAIFHIDDINTLKFLYGEASKIVNDDSNQPEITRTYEINYIYSKDRNFLSVSLFRNELDDLFTQDIEILPGGVFAYSINRDGQIKTDGLELILQTYLTDNLLAELSYTYQKTDDIKNNTDAPYSPDNLAQAKLSYNKKNNTYSLLGRYTDSMSPINNLGDTIDSYTIFDINYRRENVFGNAYFDLKVTNIFDEEIRYPTNPLLNPIIFTTLDRGTIGPERSIFGTLGWKF